MTIQTATIRDAIRTAGLDPIRSTSCSSAKYNAQNAMEGRTHYFDDSTLRYFHSRVLSSRVSDDGVLHYAVTSDAMDYQNKTRGFRYVIHDLTGHVLDRPEIENAHKTSKAARTAMYAALDKLDAAQVLREAIASKLTDARRAVDSLEAAEKMLRPERPTLGEMTITPITGPGSVADYIARNTDAFDPA